MKQMTLATIKGFEVHGRATRKAAFPPRMEMLVPWAAFCALIEPHYSQVGNGRPPVGLERILRMCLIANWFNQADEACENALYDIAAFRDFCRIDLGRERVPDATTLLNFSHLLEGCQTGLIHGASVTPSNAHDSQELPDLLHGDETRLYGDSAYRGQNQRRLLKTIAPNARTLPISVRTGIAH